MFVNEEVCETVFIILTKKLTTKLTTALTMSSLQLFLLSGQSGDAKCLLFITMGCLHEGMPETGKNLVLYGFYS